MCWHIYLLIYCAGACITHVETVMTSLGADFYRDQPAEPGRNAEVLTPRSLVLLTLMMMMMMYTWTMSGPLVPLVSVTDASRLIDRRLMKSHVVTCFSMQYDHQGTTDLTSTF